ncbi:hypothetical protein [Variovorax beijingensis]|uniref:hypothetical protein n=1 Tax=Variovorax beijingensis TaxID=2496117 RepID=UPI00119CB8B9|nr:hypothetical protein [Variovorax beijingensis]
MAILAVPAADLVAGGGESRPDRRRCALRNRFRFERWQPLLGTGGVETCHPALQHLDIDVAGQTRVDHAWMDRDSADAPILVAAVELDGKKRICGLRLAIGVSAR